MLLNDECTPFPTEHQQVKARNHYRHALQASLDTIYDLENELCQ